MAGTLENLASTQPEQHARTAYDLKKIPVLNAGIRLRPGAIYLDLRDPRRCECTATGEQVADEEYRYVPRDEAGYELWDRLRIGVAPSATRRREPPAIALSPEVAGWRGCVGRATRPRCRPGEEPGEAAQGAGGEPLLLQGEGVQSRQAY